MLSILLMLMGCDQDTTSDGLSLCTGPRKVMYDPLHAKEMWSFPDDFTPNEL